MSTKQSTATSNAARRVPAQFRSMELNKAMTAPRTTSHAAKSYRNTASRPTPITAPPQTQRDTPASPPRSPPVLSAT